MQRSLGETRGRDREAPRILSLQGIRYLLNSKWKQRQAAGCRLEPTANPHAVEGGKGSMTIVAHHVYTLTEALITF